MEIVRMALHQSHDPLSRILNEMISTESSNEEHNPPFFQKIEFDAETIVFQQPILSSEKNALEKRYGSRWDASEND